MVKDVLSPALLHARFDFDICCFRLHVNPRFSPGGLLSILKIDMGAYSRGSLFEGGGLLKRFVLYMGAYSKPRVFLHAIIILGLPIP